MNDSERIVLDIPVSFTPERLAELCKVSPESSAYEEICDAAPLVNEYGRPKAILRWVSVDSIEDDVTVLGGIPFKSRVVAEKLSGMSRVFVTVMTAGEGLEQCEDLEDDLFLDLYRGALLYHASAYVKKYLEDNFGYDGSSMLNPGSLPDWPIGNNHQLFSLIGGTEEIGVTLNEAGYIHPWNSASGIHFAGGGYQNCSLCKNYDCVGRRAAFDRAEYVRIFGVEP